MAARRASIASAIQPRVDPPAGGGLRLRALVEDLLALLLQLVDLVDVLVLADLEALLLDPQLFQREVREALPPPEDFFDYRHLVSFGLEA